ncbi:MAG: penicillin-binding transpeptidase domain-containing protein [Ruminococcus sp.]|jgi:cell division protein FtsI/penicillin-binding protein 2
MKARSKRKILIPVFILIILAAAAAVSVFLYLGGGQEPEELLEEYMGYIEEGKYEQMYEMLDEVSASRISKEDFIARNQNIYEGIEASDINVKVSDTRKEGKEQILSYTFQCSTLAGEISFENEVSFVRESGREYRLFWEDSVIFPYLESSDKVRVSTEKAERGSILDRNGEMLAGKGVASSVGLVPGKMSQTPEEDIAKLAELLEMDAGDIEDALNASWVQEESFVPLKTLPKEQNLEAGATEDEQLTQQLLSISGVMITDTQVRYYPLGEAAAHLTGYVQNVTAEDLEEHKGEGYTSDSQIGRSGLEALYEEELRGQNGCRIYIEDEEGSEKIVLAYTPKEDGKDIQVTIDGDLQKRLYEEYSEDKSCSAAMNPYTGEVLALVSTPSYDSNDFILGMDQEQWDSLNADENMPLYNRFRQTFTPGSVLKPVTAAIGLSLEAFTAEEDFGNLGTRWQKDSSWGDYYVTTLHESPTTNLENAMIYSDNIYFAQGALKIGAENFMKGLDALGFNEELPFEISMSSSQYANEGAIDSEIQLADSGYGQGEVMVNPLHLASIYTAFLNGGNMIQPKLLYEEQPEGKIWISEAFSADAASAVLDDMVQVINNPEGTGYEVHREDMVLAGKTGTAEIKESQEDETGTELGWMGVMTTDEHLESPILLMTMVEDVKDRGGSGYVTEHSKNVMDWYLSEKAGMGSMETGTEEGEIEGTFTSSEIDETVFQRMNGKSYVENPDIALEDLRYLQVSYYDFNHQVQTGELVVNAALTEDFLYVFEKLFESEYEIQSLRLIDDYWAGDGQSTDERSMAANNSSAFCYRKIAGSDRLSNHAKGCAVDINPLQNPYVRFRNNEPEEVTEEAMAYVDRSNVREHMITHEDLCYQLFTERGFAWGGDWESPKDYQHFEKQI